MEGLQRTDLVAASKRILRWKNDFSTSPDDDEEVNRTLGANAWNTEIYRNDKRVYGHLPTLSMLEGDDQLEEDPDAINDDFEPADTDEENWSEDEDD